MHELQARLDTYEACLGGNDETLQRLVATVINVKKQLKATQTNVEQQVAAVATEQRQQKALWQDDVGVRPRVAFFCPPTPCPPRCAPTPRAR